MTSVEFNTTAASEAIRKAMNQLDDMTPLFQRVTEYMIEVTRQRFVTGTAPDGTKWAPKKQSTLERYKRLGYGDRTKPLIGGGTRLSREVVGAASRSGSVIGSALIYSRVMQEGAAKGAFGADGRGRPIPWGRIPARVWLGVSAVDETAIVEIAEEYVARSLGEIR